MNTDFLHFADRAWEITYDCQRESQKCSYERKWTYEVDVNMAPVLPKFGAGAVATRTGPFSRDWSRRILTQVWGWGGNGGASAVVVSAWIRKTTTCRNEGEP